ncbi:hypothetical protein H7X46_25120 [Pseudonocardia sp. C8]|uniref:DUF6924 domain-containing protein n=1 Tax=Pseudonocardia sp. C8 TaxID=2762759 RepID=UPI001642CA67|nr:hypothetical protein [Pseudonocardia sp. C8]MBC3194335.1 hypothetical protein [Pseudonocardia sp. C8]
MEFPPTRRTPLVRTCPDSGEGPWNELLGILAPAGTPPPFDVVEEDLFGGWPVERVVAVALEDGLAGRHRLLYVVDEPTLTDHGFPVVAADLRDEPGRTFRIAAAALARLPGDGPPFGAFADHAELQPDRVFRGFP